MEETNRVNRLLFGDNLPWLQDRSAFPDESVDLVYLDPPFNSNADYNVIFKEQSGEASRAQFHAFTDTWHWVDAEETYRNFVNTAQNAEVIAVMEAFRSFLKTSPMMAYLAMMAPRLVELHRILKDTGSLFLHCDPTASHCLRLLLDAIFGPANFRNEIIWKRTNAHNDPKRFGRIHDVLLFYQKAPRATFYPHFSPLPAGHVRERFDKEDSKGWYKLENPTGPGPRYGDSGEPWLGFNPTERNRAWAPPRKLCEKLGIDNSLPTRKKLDALLKAGRIELPKTPGNIPMIKVYLEDVKEDEGTAFQDIWAYQPYTQGYYYGDSSSCVDQDVAWMGPTSGERLGYQTQKPEGLMARIIESSTKEGDTVLDPFCGCGTTVAVAQDLKRRWTGIDITYLAINLIKRRLESKFGKGIVKFLEKGQPVDLGGAQRLAELDRFQFQQWALNLLGAIPLKAGSGKGADRGVDGWLFFYEAKDTRRRILVQVKSGDVKRSDVATLLGDVNNQKAAGGILITLDAPTPAMRKEAVEAGRYTSSLWKRRTIRRFNF